jgi:hypothetical protein
MPGTASATFDEHAFLGQNGPRSPMLVYGLCIDSPVHRQARPPPRVLHYGFTADRIGPRKEGYAARRQVL